MFQTSGRVSPQAFLDEAQMKGKKMANKIKMTFVTEDGVCDEEFTQTLGEGVPSAYYISYVDDMTAHKTFDSAMSVMDYLEGEKVIEKVIAEMEGILTDDASKEAEILKKVFGEKCIEMFREILDMGRRETLNRFLSHQMLLILFNLRRGECFLPKRGLGVFAL